MLTPAIHTCNHSLDTLAMSIPLEEQQTQHPKPSSISAVAVVANKAFQLVPQRFECGSQCLSFAARDTLQTAGLPGQGNVTAD